MSDEFEVSEKILKIQGQLGKETIEELDAMGEPELKTRIAQAHQAIRDTKAELEKNVNYRQAQGVVSDLKTGFTAVKKRQNAVSEYCLHLLDAQGKPA